MPMAVSPHLELIHGGRARTWRREGLEVVAAAPGRPPFSVERTVVEEDRWRVVGASPSRSWPGDLMRPSSLIVHSGLPKSWQRAPSIRARSSSSPRRSAAAAADSK